MAEDERVYPTEGCLVWSSPHTIKCSPFFWPRPDDFIPDRWLVQPCHDLYPIKGARRPFEFGPGNCIRQELALLEMNPVLVLAIRRFHFCMPYAEWDQLHPAKFPRNGAGKRAYQTDNEGSSEGMLCRDKNVPMKQHTFGGTYPHCFFRVIPALVPMSSRFEDCNHYLCTYCPCNGFSSSRTNSIWVNRRSLSWHSENLRFYSQNEDTKTMLALLNFVRVTR